MRQRDGCKDACNGQEKNEKQWDYGQYYVEMKT